VTAHWSELDWALTIDSLALTPTAPATRLAAIDIPVKKTLLLTVICSLQGVVITASHFEHQAPDACCNHRCARVLRATVMK
jgi:hypothetical protein